jgi:long-chain acyl-CoA synthetase
LRTGDIGVKDPDGFRHVVGRKKDLILRGGFNVHPRDIEQVLARHPAVAEVAFIGIPRPTHGEEILAVIVPGATGRGERERERSARVGRGPDRPSPPAPTGGVRGRAPARPSRKVLNRVLRERFADLAA